MKYDVIVLGAGAAGLMAAIEAGRRGRSVVVLERNAEAGRKIVISGGGRCNFTNAGAGPANYFSNDPDFCRPALAAYPPARIIGMVERHGIAYHEKKLGQLFCDGSAREVVAMLLAECAAAGVDLRCGCEIAAVEGHGPFRVVSNLGEFEAPSLVVATGGLSVPQIGATSFGYAVAKQFRLPRVPMRPGLVPLTFGEPEQALFASLSGVAIEVAASAGGRTFVENLLFTHRGLSGPAILQVSSAWREGEAITVDLVPHRGMHDILQGARRQPRELVSVLTEFAPRRFVQAWCAAYAPSKLMARYRPAELDAIADRLHAWELRPAGTAGFGKAEVTLGGVNTAALDPKTMQARRIPGLFFIGEVLDVTGWLGGYNFQWAWASGYAAGQVA